ncbi:MAG: hypothetical protein WA610_13095 [Thermodesulfovibrionales bacterium]
MPDTSNGRAATTDREPCLDISLQSTGSTIGGTGGREIQFARAILKIRNVCDAEVVNVVPHATLGQEGGTVQDVSDSFSRSAPLSIPPGGAAEWDVYDLLLPVHPGTASKIHMFGYRAALNWRFDLTVWAEYLTPVSSLPAQTSASRWALRWSVADPSGGEIGLAIEKVKD